MRNSGARVALAAVVAGALVVTQAGRAPALAAPVDDDVRTARELFRQAMADQDAHRHDAALEKLRRVAAVKTTPVVHFYISYNEEKLGQLATAVVDMRAAAAELGALAATDDGAAKLALFAKNELAGLEPRVPHLDVRMDRSARDETLSVDGAPIASSAWAKIPVDPGSHHLIARAKDRADDARDVTVGEGQTVVVSFVAADKRTNDQDVAAASASGAPATNADHEEAAARARTLAIATTAGAVAFVAGGIAAYLVAGNDSTSARARCATEVTCDPSRGAIRTFDALALTGFVGGAALASVAIVSWVRAGREASDTAAKASLVLGPGRAMLEGTF